MSKKDYFSYMSAKEQGYIIIVFLGGCSLLASAVFMLAEHYLTYNVVKLLGGGIFAAIVGSVLVTFTYYRSNVVPKRNERKCWREFHEKNYKKVEGSIFRRTIEVYNTVFKKRNCVNLLRSLLDNICEMVSLGLLVGKSKDEVVEECRKMLSEVRDNSFPDSEFIKLTKDTDGLTLYGGMKSVFRELKTWNNQGRFKGTFSGGAPVTTYPSPKYLTK